MISIQQLYEHFLHSCGVTTDTRNIAKGQIFFALRGNNFDGNLFATKAIEAGAAFAVIDNPAYATTPQCLLVEDVLQTLQALATYHRQQLSIPVIGITGSNGKTTVKELLFSVLRKKYRAYCTQGNLNNHIGVPLTLLQIPHGAEIAIIEMGANHQGEIAALSAISNPTHGLITSIGKAHLEGFGGIEGVKKGKSELYKFLQARNEIVFLNVNQEYLSELNGNYSKTVRYGTIQKDSTLDYYARLIDANPFVHFSFETKGEWYEVTSNLFGQYNYDNLLTAVAVGLFFEVPPKDIVAALEDYTPTNNRTQIVKKGSNSYLLDAYNANPTSMRAAVDEFSRLDAPKKILVLGEMREMGAYSADEHCAIAEYAGNLGFDDVFLVGTEFAPFADFVTQHFSTTAELKAWLNEQPPYENTFFLLKGSRGIRLETLLSE